MFPYFADRKTVTKNSQTKNPIRNEFMVEKTV